MKNHFTGSREVILYHKATRDLVALFYCLDSNSDS